MSLVGFAAGLFVALPQPLGGRMTYVVVSGHSMEPTMHLGDLAVIRRASSYRVGDVIAYRVPGHAFDAGAVVIHRIVGGDAGHGFTTRGDNNHYDDPWHPHASNALGATVGRVPGVGVAFAHLRGPLPLAAFAGLLGAYAAFAVGRPGGGRRRRGTLGTAT